ncbi:MAG: TVP38/TMEM64 family protein [Myxococcota bacterium]
MTQAIAGAASFIRDAGALGVAVYAAVYVLATVLMLPGSIVTLAAGFAYGPIGGTLVVSPASVAGATAAFLIARSRARPWVERRIGARPRLAAIDEAMARSGFRMVALLRLSPLLPFNLLNYALGLTRVRVRDYVLASFVGMLPGTLLYNYLGSLITNASRLAAGERPDAGAAGQILYWGGLAATIAATILITRASRRALDQALRKTKGH